MPVLQNAGLALVEFIKLRKVLGISRADLADGVIHEPPPCRRALLYEVQIIRTEQHRRERSGKLGRGFFDRVHRYLLSHALTQHYAHGLLAVVAYYLRQYLRAVAAEADELPVKPSAETFTRGKHIHRL